MKLQEILSTIVIFLTLFGITFWILTYEAFHTQGSPSTLVDSQPQYEQQVQEKQEELKEITEEVDYLKQLEEIKEQHLATAEAYFACNEEGFYGGLNGSIIDESNNFRYDECQQILKEWQKIAPLYEDEM